MSNSSVRLALVKSVAKTCAAGEPVDQIGVDRADDRVAALELGGEGGFVLDQPAEF